MTTFATLIQSLSHTKQPISIIFPINKYNIFLLFSTESNNVARNYHHQQQPHHHPHNSKWCRVAYWEFRDRVGDQECLGNAVNVLTASSSLDGSGAVDALETVELSRYLVEPPLQPSESRQPHQQINLLSFFRSRRHPTSELAKTRSKIGLGVSLFRDEEDDSVWLYNRSACPVFVSSRTLSTGSHHRPNNQPPPPQPHPAANGGGGVLPVPTKVPPGHIIKAYDFAVASRLQRMAQLQQSKNTHNHFANKHHHPHHHHEFSFSFVKGFGANYSRPDTLQCPCWVEVFLEPPCVTTTTRQPLSDDSA